MKHKGTNLWWAQTDIKRKVESSEVLTRSAKHWKKGDEKGLEFLVNGLCRQPRCACWAGSKLLHTNWQHPTRVKGFKCQFHNVINELSAFFPLTLSFPFKKYKSDNKRFFCSLQQRPYFISYCSLFMGITQTNINCFYIPSSRRKEMGENCTHPLHAKQK